MPFQAKNPYFSSYSEGCVPILTGVDARITRAGGCRQAASRQ
jgi:hypothetical protein